MKRVPSDAALRRQALALIDELIKREHGAATKLWNDPQWAYRSARVASLRKARDLVKGTKRNGRV